MNNIPAATIVAALGDKKRWQAIPTDAQRMCRGAAPCGLSGAKRTSVRLWSDTGTRTLNSGNAGTGAILIGKIQNLGSDSTIRYNLAPGKIYAVYIMQDAAGAGRYEIWEAHGTKKMADGGPYISCPPPHRTYSFAFAVFTDCDNPPTLLSPQPGPSLLWESAAPVTTHDDGPAWFTCTAGCCTVGPE